MNKINKNGKRSSFYNTSEILNILKQKAVYRANDFSLWEKKIIDIKIWWNQVQNIIIIKIGK